MAGRERGLDGGESRRRPADRGAPLNSAAMPFASAYALTPASTAASATSKAGNTTAIDSGLDARFSARVAWPFLARSRYGHFSMPNEL